MNIKNVQRRSMKLSIFSLTVFLLLLGFSVYSSIEMPGQNTFSSNINGVDVTISPQDVYYRSDFLISPLIEITMDNLKNSTVNIREYIQYNSASNETSFNLSPHEFLKVYQSLNQSELSSGKIRLNLISSFSNTSFKINMVRTVFPQLAEISFLLSFPFYFIFAYFFNGRNKMIPYLILSIFFIISPFFGQRYDMYFMISSPLHLLQHVDPFIASPSLPGGVKWEYPPIFLYYGTSVEYIISRLHLVRFPNNVIYPGILWGYNSMAWRGYVSSDLPYLYILMKIPMIISTFIIFLILRREIPQLNTIKAWLLNPAVILIGILWGQLDVIAAATIILSMMQLKSGNTSLSAIYATIGTFVKIFPVFLIPIIIIESKNKLRDLIIIISISVASILPYFLTGNFVRNIMELIYSRSVPTYNNSFSANGITWQVIIMDLGIKNFPSLSLIIFLPSFLIIILLYAKRRLNLYYTIIMIFSLFFLTYNYVNPQYFIIVIPILLLMKEIRLFVVYSLIPCIYVLLNYSLPYFINPYFSYNYYSSILGQIEHIRQYATSSYAVMWPFIIISSSIYVYTFILSLRKISRKPGNNLPDGMVSP